MQDNTKKPFFVLAPMDDVTDIVFREVVATCAPPDLYFSEFVNVDGLQSPGRPKLLKKLRFNKLSQPFIVQIWGREPENFFKTAQQIADGTFAKELGLAKGISYHGVDLNMGCPQSTEIKNGTCAALINDRPRAQAIIKATQEGLAGRLPLSVKTRLGYNQIDMSWIEFLLNHNLDMLTIHGRTKAQKSKVPANWEAIGQVSKLRDQLSPKTQLVGNGDVMSRARGLELAARYNLDGMMIGRGIFQDPYIFAQKSPWHNYSKRQRIDLYKVHIKLFAETWKGGERPMRTLNKFCKIYINGFDGAKELREKLMSAKSIEQLQALLESEPINDLVAASNIS